MNNAYKCLEKIVPLEGQKYAVYAYFLHETPGENGVVQSRFIEKEQCNSVGMIVFLRAFADRDAAVNFASALIESTQVRTIVAVPTSDWRDLKTVMRIDQTIHKPVAIDKRLMEAGNIDASVFSPTYQIRNGLSSVKLLQERADTVAKELSFDALTLLNLYDEMEQMRITMQILHKRSQDIHSKIKQTKAEYSVWNSAERNPLTDLLGPLIESKISTVLEDLLLRINPDIQESVVSVPENMIFEEFEEFVANETTII